ncbi:MAG: bifunctional chorismate mutase/prephenate dehydratase [Ruthenibacterium sp.]
MDALSAARAEIDAADKQMAMLFATRMEAVRAVLAYKKEHQMPILDAAREEAVVQKNLALLPPDAAALRVYYEDFIRHNMALSRAWQAKLRGDDTVAYQGVPGAFSFIALSALFPYAQAKACARFGDVFDAVENDSAAYGVLPFENSHAGDVADVLDLCFAHPKICVTQVYDLAVTQNLLCVPGACLADIKTVLSHPQALQQSARFLKNLNVTQKEYPNTAVAAQFVAETGDKTIAAIAAKETADLYGLTVLAQDINESTDNTTRFIVIGKELPAAGNRFCLLFTVEHTAGSLARVIQIIGAKGYNMECIKSRPMPRVSWEYYFYTELVGDVHGADALLASLQSVCKSVRVLGVYHRAEKENTR